MEPSQKPAKSGLENWKKSSHRLSMQAFGKIQVQKDANESYYSRGVNNSISQNSRLGWFWLQALDIMVGRYRAHHDNKFHTRKFPYFECRNRLRLGCLSIRHISSWQYGSRIATHRSRFRFVASAKLSMSLSSHWARFRASLSSAFRTGLQYCMNRHNKIKRKARYCRFVASSCFVTCTSNFVAQTTPLLVYLPR